MFETVGGAANYIRRRRLMQALSLLVLPSARKRPNILDVAIECGFSSDMVFARAFRKMFSLAPSMVRSMSELQSLELDQLLMALDKISQPVIATHTVRTTALPDNSIHDGSCA